MSFTIVELKTMVQEIAAVDLDGSRLSETELLDQPLKQLGCDSLAMLDVTAEIERVYGISIPDDVVLTLKTARQVLDFVNDAAE